jgi:hypothetical protein
VDSALFRAHPEFAVGEFDVSVIAPGRMLIQATSPAPTDETDPVFDAFLGFLEHQMAQRPDLITSVTEADRRSADDLLRGVESTPDEDLGDGFALPNARPTPPPRKRARKTTKK